MLRLHPNHLSHLRRLAPKRLLHGVRNCFKVLSPSDGQVTHVLLTRSPLLFFRWSKLRWKKKRSTCMY
ncbi:hypothetical protein CWC54_07645 [Enterococcus faecium]|nr:hypothetical protein CWC54_07645 [Enterococcus faecium]